MTASRDRALELLADRATQGLAEPERVELDVALRELGDLDPDGLDRVAAAIDLALAPVDDEPLPDHLRERIEAEAPAIVEGARRRRRRGPTPPPSRRWLPSGREVAGWATAAGILLVLVVGRFFGDDAHERYGTASEQRAEFVQYASDLIELEWSSAGDPTGAEASGDLVWSNLRQAGYLRIRGLAVNNPLRNQYQLWVFDARRDDRYPVDAGIFDVAEGSDEIVIAIRPKLEISAPALFAVTVERPGGVVVSDRARLTLLAQVDPS